MDMIYQFAVSVCDSHTIFVIVTYLTLVPPTHTKQKQKQSHTEKLSLFEAVIYYDILKYLH